VRGAEHRNRRRTFCCLSLGVSGRPLAVFSTRDLAINFRFGSRPLCAALYFAWIVTIEAVIPLVILVAAAMAVTTSRSNATRSPDRENRQGLGAKLAGMGAGRNQTSAG
jgi:hypothetical protein